jgi:hypothetical protein
MDELHLMVVSFIENPVVFEGKAGEVGRVIMICVRAGAIIPQ